jgi:nucleoside-diphosphate-sugar epimerase
VRVFVTGGSGVLGRRSIALLRAAGNEITAAGRDELDLFDADAVRRALNESECLFHLATRIPPREERAEPEAWRENDRLRREATPILVDAAETGGVERFILPSIAFVYPSSGPVDESTPLADDMLETARSAVDAERAVARFAENGRTGVVLRLGLLYGPGTGSDTPAERYASFGATLHIDDAGRALAAALEAPSGVYNVVGNGQRVSNERFKAATSWHPEH